MPRRAPTPCGNHGCPNPRPCKTHATRWGEGARGRTMPPGWDATRRRILNRDGHRCQVCGQPATEVDHIVRGIEDDANLRALCTRCHRAKTQAEAEAARQQPPEPTSPAGDPRPDPRPGPGPRPAHRPRSVPPGSRRN